VSFFDELWEAGAFRRNTVPLTVGGISFLLLTYWLSVAVQQDAVFAIIVVSVIWTAALVGFFTGVARHLAVGFFAAVIGGSLVTRGFLLLLWGFPVIAAYTAIDGATTKRHAAKVASAQMSSHGAWVKARRAEAPVLAAGQTLANRVNECAAAYREVDTVGSYPRNIDELQMIQCSGLGPTRADTSLSRVSKDDPGWRWIYTPGAADSSGVVRGYRVRVFEDPAVDREAPQYVTDATAGVREFRPGAPPKLVATPIEQLSLLNRCIAQVPEERSRDSEVARKYSHYDGPLDEVLHRCKALQGTITSRYPNDRYGETTLLMRRGTAVDTIGSYTVALIPVDEKKFLFQLSATPRSSNGFHPGPRSYFVTSDGSVHARNGDRATAADPVIAKIQID
jgi:hypothetical protein